MSWGWNWVRIIFNVLYSYFRLFSVVVWVNLFSSRSRALMEVWRPLFTLFTGKTWNLRFFPAWLIIWLSSFSGSWFGSNVAVLEVLSSEWFGSSALLKALREETDSWSAKTWVVFGFDCPVKDVSIAEQGPSESWIRKREEGRFSEEYRWNCAYWRKNAVFQLDVDLVWEKDDGWISLGLKLLGWITLCEEGFNDLFELDSSDSSFKKKSTEDVDTWLDGNFILDITEKMHESWDQNQLRD